MSRLHIEPFCRSLKIQTKLDGVQQFVPNSSQRIAIRAMEEQYAELGYIRAVVLKARQIGMSTLCDAVMFLWSMIFAPSRGLVIAQDARVSRALLDATKLMWETWAFTDLFGKPKYATKAEMVWGTGPAKGSSMHIHSAEKVNATRGVMSRALHCSEIAFWPDPDTLMVGLKQGLPRGRNTICIEESTANGVGGYFYDAYMAAKEGESEYLCIFIPWWRHEEYQAPQDRELGKLTAEEKALTKLMKPLYDAEEIAAKLKWRRWKIDDDLKGDEDMFRQEYPATDEEAFISKGTNVFPIDKLRAVYQQSRFAQGELVRGRDGKLEFIARPDGPLRIFAKPDMSLQMAQGYIAAADPTHAYSRNKFGSDHAIIQVIDRRTFEQIAVWHGVVTPVHLADEVAKVAEYFNWALATVEIEGPGYATIGRLTSLYPHIYTHQLEDRWEGDRESVQLGWSTNYQRKHLAVGWLKTLVVDGSLLLHDARTFEEMKNYILVDGEMAPSRRGDYDDHVMSMAIGVTCSIQAGPLPPLAARPPRFLQVVGDTGE